jgi:hypothetical protein
MYLNNPTALLKPLVDGDLLGYELLITGYYTTKEKFNSC